ncbi:MAG: hypothetical protein Q9160_008827 [Pyrenula sp. 1 TL-2023]
MSPSAILQPFQASTVENLEIGHNLKPRASGSGGPTMKPGSGWFLPSGSYTAQQIVEGCAPLLETVLSNLGQDPPGSPTARQMLLDNLASNLNIGTRESSLHIPMSDASRKEMAGQAVRVGQQLIQYASEVENVRFDPQYTIRSPCEGHLLKPPVASLMFGPRSLEHLMQVYNEYLHQMVLLRDALLPFENFEEVIIPITGKTGRDIGMRFTEQSRTNFLAELMTKQLTQKSVFKAAVSLIAPQLSSIDGYGFQYAYGSVLPSFVIGSSSTRLLRYIPAALGETDIPIAFKSEIQDYYVAQRAEIVAPMEIISAGSVPSFSDQPLDASWLSVDETSCGNPDNGVALKLHVRFSDRSTTAVDLGQIARGRRYAYQVSRESSTGSQEAVPVYVHSAADVLIKSDTGLVTAKDGGIHLILVQSSIVALALLGRIYPENVIVLGPEETIADAERVGKSLSGKPKFVIQIGSAKKNFMPQRDQN